MKVGQYFRFKAGHKARSPIPLKLRKRAYYLRTLEQHKKRRKLQYAADPEGAKAKAKQWYWENHERAIQQQRAYKATRRTELTEKQKARYHKEPEKHRAKQRAYAPHNRKRFLHRKKELNDVYVRGELAKHSILQPKDFPQELVEAKRLHLQLKRLTESTTK
jgi:hypothetical protein